MEEQVQEKREIEDATNERQITVDSMFGTIDNEGGEAPIRNYDAYDLLSLQSRLVPIMEEMFGEGTYPYFDDSISEDDRITLTVWPSLGTKKISINDEQESILRKHVKRLETEGNDFLMLIPYRDLSSEKYGRIPKSYVIEISSFVSIPETYHPYSNKYGVLVSLPKNNYLYRYEEISVHVLDQIRYMYDTGIMILRDMTLVEAWSCQILNHEEGLCYPVWEDRRITNAYSGPVGFLRSRLQGDNTISVRVGSSQATRHLISKMFPCQFIGEHARFKVENLDDARTKLTKIPIAVSSYKGSIITISVISIKQAKDYQEVMKERGYKDTSIYRDENGVIVSFSLPYNVDDKLEIRNAISSYFDKLK